VAGTVIELKDHHILAVKMCISQLVFGSTLFRVVPPQPISNLIIVNHCELVELDRCVYYGLGFEPMWTVVLETCLCAYHPVCCKYHFQEFTTCSSVKCKKEMHGDWWAAHGIVKPGTRVLAA